MGFGIHYPKIQHLGLVNVKAEGVGEKCGSREVALTFPHLLFRPHLRRPAPGQNPNRQALLSSPLTLLA